ncbi:MAG: aminotransferase [Micavibrio sp.]|nr:aminotransferase [Micavibrio sp.]|tara:strand:- start:3087 stop:4202 length:1116 start_codon:yes stop_codon:yes gene_type:complete
MSSKDDPIYVVRPNLPPFEEFTRAVKTAWDRRWLTNGGALHQELETALEKRFGGLQVSLFNNATIGLMAACAALDLKGEVITTPFSFIATAHSLLWNSLTPVFVDIDPHSLNIDPAKVEAAITDKTSAIMAVHCYGHPCDVEAIEAIAKKHNLKVIYDAAHAFDLECHCGNILQHGDISVLSFHATKVFNTFEGGAIVCKDPALKTRIEQFKNFGIVDDEHIGQTGLNGKMSEAHAAMGLAQLPHMDEYRKGRARVDALYRCELADVKGIKLLHSGAKTPNYAYFPVLITDECPISRDALYDLLKDHNIIARRYFYPLISDFPMYQALPSSAPDNLPIAQKASSQILCLPIYPDLSEAEQMRVINVIKEAS